MTKLEELIVDTAQRALNELRYAIADPQAESQFRSLATELDTDWRDVANTEQTQRMMEVLTLVGLARVKDSGMSDEAIAKLQMIETENAGLIRTASWLRPPQQR